MKTIHDIDFCTTVRIDKEATANSKQVQYSARTMLEEHAKQAIKADILEIVNNQTRFIEDIPSIDELIKEQVRLKITEQLEEYFK